MADVGFHIYEPNGIVAVGTNTQGVWPIATLTVKDVHIARVAWGEALYRYIFFEDLSTDFSFPCVVTYYTTGILRRTCILESTDGVFDSASTVTFVDASSITQLNNSGVPELSVRLPTPVQYSNVFVLPIPTQNDVAVLPQINANSDSSRLLIKDNPQSAGILPTYPADPRPVDNSIMHNFAVYGMWVHACDMWFNANTPIYELNSECLKTWVINEDISKAGQTIWEQVGDVFESKFYILGKAG